MKSRNHLLIVSTMTLIAFAVYVLPPSTQAADEPPKITLPAHPAADKPPILKLSLHPAPEPSPALKYQLLPSFLDQTPGNAVSDYNRVIIQWQDAGHKKPDKVFYDWLEMPLDKLPLDAVRAELAAQKTILDGLHMAARRDRCDWQLPLRETNPIMMQLPELSVMREFARLLLVKARLEIAEGKFDQAVETLQTGYAMSRHIAEAPLIINTLVGMAVANMMTGAVEDMASQPGSPNMYWAVTTLPSPIVGIGKATSTEMNLLYLLVPELRDVDKIPSTPEHWRAFMDRIGETCLRWMAQDEQYKQKSRFTMLALAAKDYPNCKKALLAAGVPAEKVEAMPVAQVVAVTMVAEYDEFRDDLFKWFALPYWQAEAGLDAAEKQLTDLRSGNGELSAMSFASILLPAVSNCKAAEARADETIALARTLEAIRLYAAGHDGRLPERLDEITAVPLPLNPITGRPFEYQRQGDAAVIKSLGPKRYGKTKDKIIEIRIRSAK